MFSPTCDPLALTVLATGVILHGLLELLLAKRGPAKALLPLILAGVFTVLAGVGYLAAQPGLVWQGALLLVGAELLLAGLRSPVFAFAASASRLLRFDWLKYGAVQSLVLLIMGSALLAAQIRHFDADLEKDMAQTDLSLGMMGEGIDLPTLPSYLAQTDAGNPVPLFSVTPTAKALPATAEQHFIDNHELQNKVIRRAASDIRYNCHGWVFTAGQYWLRSGAIESILKDNDYQAVAKPQPGDVAVFRNSTGEVTHTGLVRGMSDRLPLIESKWGQMGRYVHTSEDHGYENNVITYYHTTRGTHLLKGLSDSPETHAVSTPTMP